MMLLSTSCSSRIEVMHLNNYTSKIEVDESVKCLWLPIEDNAPEALVVMEGEGCDPTPLNIRLATTNVDYYMPFEMDGVDALKVDNCSYESICWQELQTSSDGISKKFRQRIHISPERGWMNDPNGMFFLDGEWHLYYQYNPYGAKWGNMSWAHAVSRDLVEWEHLPTVLYPDNLGAIFSGSAVVDEHNTAGFGEGAVVAIYTSAGTRQSQSIAYSLDKGKTYTKYEHNPVLTSHRVDFRDPKVFWHTPTEKWIMILAAGNAMEIYSSTNLKEWKFESRFGEQWGYHTGVWECPDLFELPYKDGTKWVMLCSLTIPERGGSSVQYFVGDFDGHTFTPEGAEQGKADLLNYGRDYYATVSWSDVKDGRRVVIGWQNNWDYANSLPTDGFRGYMSYPQQLSLIEYNGVAKLIAQPVEELSEKCRTIYQNDRFEVKENYNACQHNANNCARVVECNIENVSAQIVGIKLFNENGQWVDICFDFGAQEFRVDRTNSGLVDFHERFSSISIAPLSEANTQNLTLLIDRCSVECYTDIASLSNLVFPSSCYTRMSFYTIGGSAVVNGLTIGEIE